MTTIEVGKYYKDGEDGNKLEALAIRGIVVYFAIHFPDGTFGANSRLMEDAIEELSLWIDEPAIPWDSVPEWCQWWAVDADGAQWFTSEKPERISLAWGVGGGGFIRLPESHRIPYVGDWRESLRQRPGKEVVK